MSNYSRDRNGKRFTLQGGMDTVSPRDMIPEGRYAYLQNIRRRTSGRITGRPTTGAPLYTLPAAPHTIARMNDSTPSGPVAGFVRVTGAAGVMYVNSTAAASGFSGNPLAVLPFGPDQSVQPWAYIGDSSQSVTITSSGQPCTGMVKVRSDGLTRKTGIKEPQSPPVVTVNTITVPQYLTLPANTPPWTNVGGVNANFNYTGTDVQPPYPSIILTPIAGSTVALTVTGTATVNGATHAPGDAGPSSANYPGSFITTPKIVVFAFTDANGNIIAQVAGGAPVLGNVGAAATLTVPAGAAQLQIGIDSQGGTFGANSGSFLVTATVSTSSITSVSAIVGQITAYIWGDSPHGDGAATYIWKNPNDVGTGIPRIAGTAQATANNNSWILDSSTEDKTVPVQWQTNNSAGASVGLINLFTPALESEGYADFNACFVGSIFVPASGVYHLQFQHKDQMLVGIGGGATSQLPAGWPATGPVGQTISVVNGLPLVWIGAIDGGGGAHTEDVLINFPTMGIYPIEIDWTYWFHTGRKLIVTMAPTAGAAPAVIPPLAQGVRTNVQYWGKYRAAETGAQSNPGPPSPIQQTPVLANQVTCPYSTDPQVTKVDYYRQDQGLPNPTYVITGPNDGLGGTINGIVYNTAVEDTLTDLQAAANQIMQTDDFEPFPSIDTPKSGMVTIVDGVVTWKSGDKFNTRWLPGTLMLIGSPAQNAYSLVARPISTTQIVIPTIPDTIGDVAGDGVPYNIAQPLLAQQPMPSMWGPDSFGFMHACGDPNDPGAYLWTKGNNPDSAPDTNRLRLTSQSESLMGGGLINGVSVVFSPLRAWLMYPNFADALATTQGVSGTPWNPILAVTTRGLYLRNVLCSIGGKALAFRATDGICLTSGGGETSLTDDMLYNLFPHENFTPVPLTIGPFTVYPPNDALPQKLAYQNGYIYYDYVGTDGNSHTLVFDEAAKGWGVDVGNPAFTVHANDAAPGVSDTAVGCVDGSVRVLQSGGTEVATSIVATGADNAGDARASKRIADVFVKAVVAAGNPITAALYSGQYATALAGFSPSSLTGTGTLASYILDWGTSQPQDVSDLALALSWPTASADEIDQWQPSLLPLPIGILSRVTEGLSHGLPGYQHVYLCNLMYAATAPVTLALVTDQGTVTITFPAGGTLAAPVKVMRKPVANKFKVCAYRISSTQAFYLYDFESWVGAWGRSGSYSIVHPFAGPAQPGGVE